MPGLAAPPQEQACHDHSQAVQRDHRQPEDQQERRQAVGRVRHVEQEAPDAHDRHRPQHRGHEAAERHAEQDGPQAARGQHVELEVARPLVPVELRGHHPDDVGPEGDRRPAHDHVAREPLGCPQRKRLCRR